MLRVMFLTLILIQAGCGGTEYNDQSPGISFGSTGSVTTEPLIPAAGWYCFQVSGPAVAADDAHSMCYRGMSLCTRKAANFDTLKGISAGSCEAQAQAICLQVKTPGAMELELCAASGPECEARRRKLSKDKRNQVSSCAVTPADTLPTGGVMAP